MDQVVSDALAQSRTTRERDGAKSETSQSFYHVSTGGIVEVRDEWKGGISGGTLSEFRKSLSACKSSNWRIIDRNVDQCRGIWSWVPDQRLRVAICTEWAKEA